MSIFKEEFLLENSSSFGSGDKFIKSSTTKLLERNIFKNMQIDDFFEPLINNKYTKIQEKSLKRKKYFQEIEHILSSQIINFIKATTNQNTDNIKSITFSKSSIKILFDDNMEENFEIIINEE
ncbi:MAG: hypothetical protein LBU14_00760 [Candidatus Peribacteria bacterium]|jgi:hypothetical protein|nr:hypothetical protein [Candidatus Peribacteria bacterium]